MRDAGAKVNASYRYAGYRESEGPPGGNLGGARLDRMRNMEMKK